jgi:hypothetical protein
MATIATVISADKLDVAAPEFPLGGAIFALACLDILQRAFNTLRTGDDADSDAADMTHPKARDRAEEVINSFRQYFDVEYHSNGLYDLTFVLRRESPKGHNFSSEHSRGAYGFANVLQSAWTPVKERLLEDFRRKRPLHPRWH